jgi:ABC-type dipeptide/oligopeptide/nickel transport system permease component
MTRYIFNRVWQALISLFILVTIIFILARITGSPVALMLPADATQEQRDELSQKLGLDQPYYLQYFKFVGDIARGDLGTSIKYDRPTIDIYMERLPNTLSLAALAMWFAIIMARPLGVLAGSKRGSWMDKAVMVFSVIGIAAPGFWVALLLIQLFSVYLGILPTARVGGFEHYILPAFCLAFMGLAAATRLLRTNLVDVLDSEYIKLAKIKGVHPSIVLWKHALRNSLITLISFLGTQVGIFLGGSLVIEMIFAWPGVGRLAYEGIIYRDYPLIQTTVLMQGILVVIANLVVDILYSYVDPRIKYK